MEIEVLNNKYKLIENDNNCFNLTDFTSRVTDYFEPFDYIFGDYAYDKLRLKGFYESTNEKARKINDINDLDNYKKNCCSYETKMFLLKKI